MHKLALTFSYASHFTGQSFHLAEVLQIKVFMPLVTNHIYVFCAMTKMQI